MAWDLLKGNKRGTYLSQKKSAYSKTTQSEFIPVRDQFEDNVPL